MPGSPVRAVLVATAATAGAAIAVSGLLATALTLASRQPAMSGHDVLTLAGMAWSATWGVRPEASAGVGTLQAGATLQAWPLTLTILTLAAALAAFRRTTRRLPGPTAVLVAGAAAVVTGLAMLVVAAVCHEGLPRLTGTVVASRLGPLGRIPLVSAAIGSALASVHARLGTSAVSGLWHAVALVAVPLLLALAADRATGGPAPVRRLGLLLAPALAGLARFVLLLPAAGLVGGIVIGLTGRRTGGELPFPLHGPQWAALVSAAIAYAANVGLWLLILGVGGRLHASADLAGHGFDLTGRVGEVAGRLHEPGLWVAVALAPLVMALATYAASRRARRDGDPPGWLAGWVLAVLVAAPALAWGSGLTLTGAVDHLGGLLSGGPALLGLPLAGLLPDTVTLHARVGVDVVAALLLAAYALLLGVAQRWWRRPS
jgi:hypothetical protein